MCPLAEHGYNNEVEVYLVYVEQLGNPRRTRIRSRLDMYILCNLEYYPTESLEHDVIQLTFRHGVSNLSARWL